MGLKPTGYQFGTFKGVFTPSILTILGVIMYLRFGWVLGNVGLFQTILIVTLATAITFLTGLSISSLATNMEVGGGGAYYIISRSLGLEPGAAVGIPLYFAQALGISFYVVGFAEAFNFIFPAFPLKLISVITLTLLTLISVFSAKLAMKTQMIILVTIIASLFSFFMGGPVPAPDFQVLSEVPNILPTLSFWTVFAVFFPAVTGIEAGLSMSGDLKNPAKALPVGTLSAIVVSYFVYLAIPIALNIFVKDKQLLIENAFIMRDVASIGFLVVLGVWGSTLSSALGAMLGAPRTLQALSRDKLVPGILGKGYGDGNDPRLATAFSFVIALVGVIAGDLNFIAPVLTMFFLTSYGLLNLSAAFEELIGSPSWRPKFRVRWGYSLAGAVGCFGAMFMINAGATFMALLVSLSVYLSVKRRELNAHWGDMRYGILMLVFHFVIYRLEERKPDLKTWRPNILVLSGPPQNRWPLIEISNMIASTRGLLTVNAILPEIVEKEERLESMRKSIRSYLHDHRIRALVNVHTSSSMMEGLQEVIKNYGFGPITPNTIILGETEKEENFEKFAELIYLVHKKRRNLLIVRNADDAFSEKSSLNIHVMWGGIRQNAGLMLAIAHLVRNNKKWSKSKLHLKTIVNKISEEEKAREQIDQFIKEQRLLAESSIIIKGNEDVFDAIANSVQDADLVFLGMRAPQENEEPKDYEAYYKNLLLKTLNFPPTIFALASEQIDFHQMFA